MPRILGFLIETCTELRVKVSNLVSYFFQSKILHAHLIMSCIFFYLFSPTASIPIIIILRIGIYILHKWSPGEWYQCSWYHNIDPLSSRPPLFCPLFLPSHFLFPSLLSPYLLYLSSFLFRCWLYDSVRSQVTLLPSISLSLVAHFNVSLGIFN